MSKERDEPNTTGGASEPEDSGADTTPSHSPRPPQPQDDQTLADELGIDSLFVPVVGGRGRLFSTAGPRSPVAEFTQDYLVLHPPQKPFTDSGPTEDIVIKVDNYGVLLDELGRPKHIAGAKFCGNTLWFSGEQKPGTLKHYAVWFDERGIVHKLYVNDEPLTTDAVFRLRNKTHDGELSIFDDIGSD